MKKETEMKSEITKKKMTPMRWVIAIVCGLLSLVLIVLLGGRLYFRLPVLGYYSASEKAFQIPGLSDGFVPQGLDYDERTDLFWVTGYMEDGSASPVYLIRRETGALEKTLWLACEDGSVYNGHAGGISVGWDYIYIAGGADRCIYAYSADEMMTAADGATVKCLGNISTKYSEEDSLRVSCLAMDDKYLYAVEFYREPSYPTPENHKLTTPAGDYQQALAVAFELNYEEGVLGVIPTPSFAMSLPDAVQGMCFGDDLELYLSTSWGASFSHIYTYDMSKLVYKDTIHFLGSDLPIYHLDSASLVSDLKQPPMAEEIVVVDGKLYTMCESASNKYMFGKLNEAWWCYATDLSEWK